ncbi:UNVERIFIED_CONTAM: hypothetical protein K2H54_054117 [Gekko kuhli]
MPPPISESSTSALPTHLKSTSDVSTPPKHTAPKNSSFASTLAKKKKEHEKKYDPKKAAHKSHTLSGTGKDAGPTLPPLQRVQPDIMASLMPELMEDVQETVLLIVPDLQGMENTDPGPVDMGNVIPGRPGVENVNPVPLDAESISIGPKNTITPD